MGNPTGKSAFLQAQTDILIKAQGVKTNLPHFPTAWRFEEAIGAHTATPYGLSVTDLVGLSILCYACMDAIVCVNLWTTDTRNKKAILEQDEIKDCGQGMTGVNTFCTVSCSQFADKWLIWHYKRGAYAYNSKVVKGHDISSYALRPHLPNPFLLALRILNSDFEKLAEDLYTKCVSSNDGH